MKEFRNKRINSIENISNNTSRNTVFKFRKLKHVIRRNYRIVDWRYSDHPILRDIGYSVRAVITIPELIKCDPKYMLYQEAYEPMKLRSYSCREPSISFYKSRGR